MPRKKNYAKPEILASALDLVDKYGKDSFSVRNIANHMDISTQPIYSNFKNSDQLYAMILLEIEKRLLQQIAHPYTDFPFRNMGYGFVLYAKEYPNLFDAFFSDIDMNRKFVKKFLKRLREIVDTDARFSAMSAKGKDSLLDTMWTFSYGYAFLIIKGLVKKKSNESIMEKILETGTAVIVYHLKKEKIV